VRLLADATVLTVQIHDDGRGFDPTATHVAGGLSGMRERVELLGGSVWIDVAPGDGVMVTAELPLTAMNNPDAAGESP
jgi:signal transduction histidine kinase